MGIYNEADYRNALYKSETSKLISESIINMMRESLKPLENVFNTNQNTNLVLSQTIAALNEPLIQLLKNTSMNQDFSVAFSKVVSKSISQLIKNLQLPKFEIDLNNTQAFESEPVSEEVAEKTVELIENTANLLEENGVDSSQIQDFKAIRKKNRFSTEEIERIFSIIVSILAIIQFFSPKDTTVNNYNQNITINYLNEKENEHHVLDETEINQICDDLSDWLVSLLSSQDFPCKHEEDHEGADSPLPDDQAESYTQDTTATSMH